MNKDSRIFIAGHRGMVGSSITKLLRSLGYNTVITDNLDLTNQSMVTDFFIRWQPEYVFLCAAKVGGIHANNTLRADFIYINSMIQANVIHASYTHGVKKLLFLGSSCIYPRSCPQPMKEEHLLTGVLEKTNEPYAIAKIAGIIMCDSYRTQYGCNFISCMPTNLYGENDKFDLNNSHVIPALIRKFYEAKKHSTDITVWGSGQPFREFMHVDDMADAALFLMLHYNEPGHINVGSGEEIQIFNLVYMLAEISGFLGKCIWDQSKPDGTPRKLLDSSKLVRMGWKASIPLRTGLERVYHSYIEL